MEEFGDWTAIDVRPRRSDMGGGKVTRGFALRLGQRRAEGGFPRSRNGATPGGSE